MKLPVRLTASAIADIEQARDWYERQNLGLGVNFVQQVDEAILRIAANPLLFQKAVQDVRRARVQRFPYGIFYRVEMDELVVIACIHHRRDRKLLQARVLTPEDPANR